MKVGAGLQRWNEELKKIITMSEEVRPYLDLDDEATQMMDEILKIYPMAITPYYLSLVDFSDPNDPIRKMCIPTVGEMDIGGVMDTSGESHNTVTEGLQHKYGETALILTTNRCAMYCRHCFRKRLVGMSDDEIARGFDDVVDYIISHKEINNALLSGGDFLMLSNKQIREYLEKLVVLEQLDLIRLATRMPVVLPQRISEDTELLDMLEEFNKRKQLYVVTQFNHPRELTDEAIAAIHALLRRGIVVKNQTVLLGGINDDPMILSELLSKLVASGAVPYYVFQCRPVTGVKNQFQLSLKKGVEIVEKAKSMLNGQAKCIKYCMSHPRGKIEIVGTDPDGKMLFKFHQAKYCEDDSRIFMLTLDDDAGWLVEDLSRGE